MEDNGQKEKIIALVVSLVLHLLLIILMLNIYLEHVVPDTEEGLEVALGIESLTSGADVADAAPAAPAAQPTPAPQTPTPANESYQTQDIEESLEMPDKTPKKTEEQLRKEREEREKRIAEDNRRKEEARKLAEEKRKQDSIKSSIAQRTKGLKGFGAGGNGSDPNAKGVGDGTGEGSKGNPFGKDGSTSTQGAANSGSNLSWSLAGRSVRGTIARPNYGSQEEGTVVVSIKVDKDGNVINTSIGRGTNISDPSLLREAQAAAKKTKFSPRTDGKDGDQFGEIKYHFKLN